MDDATHRVIGTMYARSYVIAVAAYTALSASGLARSSSPGRTDRPVASHTARSGVWVRGCTRAKKPPSGSAWSRLSAYSTREPDCSVDWQTQKAVRQMKDWRAVSRAPCGKGGGYVGRERAYPEDERAGLAYAENHDLGYP